MRTHLLSDLVVGHRDLYARIAMAFAASPVPEYEIARALETRWDLNSVRVVPMFSGHGGDSWTFRADTPEGNYFLKLKKTIPEPGVAVSLLLAERKVPAVAPVYSRSGEAWEAISGLYLLVYPLIEGRSIEPTSMTEVDWRSLGQALKGVHQLPVPNAMKAGLAKDTFVPWGAEYLSKIAVACSAFGTHGDSSSQEFAKLWKSQGALPFEFFALLKNQGQAALASVPLFCLCHADFQANNILKSAPGVMHIIDWDNPMWAPAERDLMFIAQEFREPFLNGYGTHNINEPVMSYLSSDWLLQETFDCAKRVFFAETTGPEEKQWALDLARANLLTMRDRLRNRSEPSVSLKVVS